MAPSMFPIAAGALSDATRVTTDATSPIHDAVRDRVLYDPKNDGDRISTREIVERILDGGAWPFVSPFTRDFRRRFGNEPGKARTAWDALGRPPITDLLLETPSALTGALPLFVEANAELQSEVVKTRIAHNHWVLGQLSESFADDGGRRAVALSTIDRLVAQTATVTTRGLVAARQVLFP